MKRLFFISGLAAVLITSLIAGLGVLFSEREVSVARQLNQLDQTRALIDASERRLSELLYKGTFFSQLHVATEVVSIRQDLQQQSQQLAATAAKQGATVGQIASDLDQLSQMMGAVSGAGGTEPYREMADAVIQQDLPKIRTHIEEAIEPLVALVETTRRQMLIAQGAIPLVLLVFLLLIWFALVVPAEARQLEGQARLEVSRKQALDLAKQAEAAASSKQQFLSNMSHELRTPLNGVIGLSDCLDPMIKDPEARELLSTIRASGESLVYLINDILDYSKLQAGKMTIEAEPMDMRACVTPLGRMYQQLASDKGIDFKLELAPQKLRNRVGDSHRLAQILHNLIGNSLKFTTKGFVTLKVESFPGDPMRLIVTDTGIGMTEDQVSAVFQDFVQADTSIARKFGGTGLGMSIVKQLVDAMNGGINVQSALGKGTQITLTLPLEETDGGTQHQGAAPTESVTLPKGLRIMAADDNRTNRMVLEKMLKSEDLNLSLCDGGKSATEVVKQQDFDVILLDIQMPDMDGIETLSKIKADLAARGKPMPPALAVTANTLAEHVQSYSEAGFDGHISKPFKRTELANAIVSALEKTVAPRKMAQAVAH